MNYESLVAELLDCGYADLQVLESCNYEIEDLIDEIRWNFGKEERITLNNLAFMMFEFGKRDIKEWIEKRESEINDLIIDAENDLHIAENEELKEDLKAIINELQEEEEELKQLDPSEDIESYHNYLDTSVYFVNNEEIYNKYCKGALDYFYEMTGFYLE